MNSKAADWSRFLGDVALEDLAFVIDGAPQVHHLAIHFDVHLVEVPFPMLKTPHPTNSLALNVCSKRRTETISPVPHGLVAEVNPALEEQVFDVPQRQRKTDVHQHHKPDYLRRGVKISERILGSGAAHHPSLSGRELDR